MIRIKLNLQLLFVLKRLSKARRMGIAAIVLETFREYSVGLKVVNRGHDHHRHGRTPLEQLNKYIFFFYPFKIPKSPRPR